VLVRLELDKLERPRADRVLPHLRRRYVAGVDRRIAGSQERDKRRLGPLQMKGGLVIAVGGDVVQVSVPALARVAAQLLLALAEEQVPGALHVLGGEGLAVMPFDTRAQLEDEFGAVLAP
jgi:hypothetical protein